MSKILVTKVRRSDLDTFKFGNCATCKATIVWGRHRPTQKDVPLDPMATHGTEMDPGYSRHFCEAQNDG